MVKGKTSKKAKSMAEAMAEPTGEPVDEPVEEPAGDESGCRSGPFRTFRFFNATRRKRRTLSATVTAPPPAAPTEPVSAPGDSEPRPFDPQDTHLPVLQVEFTWHDVAPAGNKKYIPSVQFEADPGRYFTDLLIVAEDADPDIDIETQITVTLIGEQDDGTFKVKREVLGP